jgi:hypothetical protein
VTADIEHYSKDANNGWDARQHAHGAVRSRVLAVHNPKWFGAPSSPPMAQVTRAPVLMHDSVVAKNLTG